jgi:uncharacterized sulfatase
MNTQPDILFIVLDTQRADRLGLYGHSKALTPNLDNFAANSVVFEQAIAPAQWTVPSHAAMFTGYYPTAHQVTQSSQKLSSDYPHLAEVMQQAGYETIGFCNNPLVGILNNGFKRGFQTFYNYGGAIPSVPKSSSLLPWPLKWLGESYTQFLRRISYPIQNFFGQSDLAFRLSLNAWLTPLWSKMANFKGQNERSVGDVVDFLSQRERKNPEKPLFLFLNLMETHMPFWPPGEFVDKVAPYFRRNKEARRLMQRWNRESFRWASPLVEPLGELEAQVLSDMYDAEVAYQDAYLGQLFAAINGRSRRRNTLTIIVADHGDGLGEHGYMGHAFNAYQELVHVPLIINWPARLPKPMRVTTPVSTRRVFHTMLAALPAVPEVAGLDVTAVQAKTLLHTINGRDPENGTAYSEIYPPLNFVRAIESRWPHLLESAHCLSLRRAVVKVAEDSPYKLIETENAPTELFNLAADPLELDNVHEKRPLTAHTLSQELTRTIQNLEQQRSSLSAGGSIDTEMDANLMQRLRGLGYLD